MIVDTLRELEAARARLAALEASVAGEMENELAALPGRYGFTTAREFIRAVRAAAVVRRSPRRGGRPRTRAKITETTRVHVKQLAQAGKTGAYIASKVGISLPSVQKIKKALGLVRKRKFGR